MNSDIIGNQVSLSTALAVWKVQGLLPAFEGLMKTPEYNSYFHKPRGIHGLPHARRVLLHSLLISHYLDLNVEDAKLLGYASVYHDIGRTHDGTCEEHGKNSVKKIERWNLFDGMALGEESKSIFRYVIEGHCIPDQEALAQVGLYQIKDTAKAITLFKVLKDADSLDRVRIGDLDISYLRHPISKKLVDLAEILYNQGGYQE